MAGFVLNWLVDMYLLDGLLWWCVLDGLFGGSVLDGSGMSVEDGSVVVPVMDGFV